MSIRQDIFSHVLLQPMEAGHPGRALLSWRLTEPGDWLTQVYVNGALYDVAIDANQREMWLHLDRQQEARVELAAVAEADAWRDQADELSGWGGMVTTAELTLVRDEALPIDAHGVVSVDGQQEPARPLWGDGDGRTGFGALQGIGQFGYDSATAAGHGLGDLGAGPHGNDAQAWVWRRDDLPAGEHTIEVSVLDGAGNTVGQLPAKAVQIDALPQPARDVRMADGFVMTWTT
jgi:hypothetical protein